MDQTTRSALPSKSEVAFRFVACTGITLALYYTPELKWSSGGASDPATIQADVLLAIPTPNAALEACAARKTPDLLVDAAMKAD